MSDRVKPPEIIAAERKVGPRNAATIKAVAEGMAPYIKDLQKRVAALEARSALHYCGVWNSQTSYGRGNAVTDKGALWVTKDITAVGERPGSSGKWQLAVKSHK